MNTIEQLAREIHALKQQVARLTGPQLAHSAIEDGAIEEYAIVEGSDGELAPQLTSIMGSQFDGTHGVLVVSGPIPPTTTAPIVTVLDGSRLRARWDGGWDPAVIPASRPGTAPTPVVAPSDLLRVEVHASIDPNLTGLLFETRRRTIEGARGGEVEFSVVPDVDYYLRFVAVTTSGKRSFSAVVGPFQAEPMVNQGDVAVAINAANSKNRIFTIPAEPDVSTYAPFVVGDLWIDTANDRRLNSWDGDSWEPQTLGGTALAADAINGKTITGALVRTDSSGPRIELESTYGLTGYDLDGEVATRLGVDGYLTARGATITGVFRTAESGPRTVIRDASAFFPAPGGGQTWVQRSLIEMFNGQIHMPAYYETPAFIEVQKGTNASGAFTNITMSNGHGASLLIETTNPDPTQLPFISSETMIQLGADKVLLPKETSLSQNPNEEDGGQSLYLQSVVSRGYVDNYAGSVTAEIDSLVRRDPLGGLLGTYFDIDSSQDETTAPSHAARLDYVRERVAAEVAKLPWGILAHGQSGTSQSGIAATPVRIVGGMPMSAHLYPDRVYAWSVMMRSYTDTAGTTAGASLRMTKSGTAAPVATDPFVAAFSVLMASATSASLYHLSPSGWFQVADEGDYQFNIWVNRTGGTGIVTAHITGTGFMNQILEDIGPVGALNVREV